MNSIIKSCLLLVMIGLLLGAIPAAAQDFKVIVNEGNSISTINKADLSNILLKKKTSFEGGLQVVSVDLPKNSATREAFSVAIHGKSVLGIKRHWQKQIFSGRGIPPKVKKTDAEVIAFVRANPGAIGYVSGETDISGVKVVSIN
jgi:ABC-type phosphate transport system substrate-binding protein